MKLIESNDYDLIGTILHNKTVVKMIGYDDIDTSYQYILIEDKELIGCFQVRPVTKCVLEGHVYILPEYWGTEKPQQAVLEMHEWIKKQGYTKIFTKVPANHVRSLKLAHKLKYKACGAIEKGIVFNNQLVTLYLFEFEV